MDALVKTIADPEGGKSTNVTVLCAVTSALADRKIPLVTHLGMCGGRVELPELFSDVKFRHPADSDNPPGHNPGGSNPGRSQR